MRRNLTHLGRKTNFLPQPTMSFVICQVISLQLHTKNFQLPILATNFQHPLLKQMFLIAAVKLCKLLGYVLQQLCTHSKSYCTFSRDRITMILYQAWHCAYTVEEIALFSLNCIALQRSRLMRKESTVDSRFSEESWFSETTTADHCITVVQ